MQEHRCVIWDVDGTIVDSGDLHWEAYRKVLAREGYELTRDRFDEVGSLRNDAFLQHALGDGIPPADIARIALAKERAYRALVQERGLHLYPGAVQWLARLARNGWWQALASSAPRENVALALRLIGDGAIFRAVVTGDEVAHGKPHPEIFLMAAQRVGLPAAQCVVVEDGPAGVEAARRAGMRVVGILSTQSQLDADVVAESLVALAPETFDRLLPLGLTTVGRQRGDAVDAP